MQARRPNPLTESTNTTVPPNPNLHTKNKITEITHNLNERNTFTADRPELAYIVREPIVNRALAGACVRGGLYAAGCTCVCACVFLL